MTSRLTNGLIAAELPISRQSSPEGTPWAARNERRSPTVTQRHPVWVSARTAGFHEKPHQQLAHR